jgi:hypothetical protein
MPYRFIKNIKFFKPVTLFEMVAYHTDLLFSVWKVRLFNIPDLLIPQLEFLRASWDVEHFYRSIKGKLFIMFGEE